MEAFKLIPPPLQKQTIIRLGIGAVSLILLFPLAIIARNTYLWLPCAAAAVFFTIGALILYKISVSGDYVVLSGICQEAGLTAYSRAIRVLPQEREKESLNSLIRYVKNVDRCSM